VFGSSQVKNLAWRSAIMTESFRGFYSPFRQIFRIVNYVLRINKKKNSSDEVVIVSCPSFGIHYLPSAL